MTTSIQHRSLRLLLIHTGVWAPAIVLILHRMVYWLGIRERCDWLMHFSGGLAATFFFWKSLALYGHYLGQLNRLGRIALAFTMGCTIALFWEIGEFASDCLRGTHIQHAIVETMKDLIYGASGAIITSLGACLWGRKLHPPEG